MIFLSRALFIFVLLLPLLVVSPNLLAGSQKGVSQKKIVRHGKLAEVKPLPKMKGFNFVCWRRGCYENGPIASSLNQAKQLGTDWIAVIPKWYQRTTTSSAIRANKEKSPTLSEIRRTINTAKMLGFKVLLKPHVSILEDGSRTSIQPKYSEKWWESYEDYIMLYADLARQTDVEMFAVGTELKRMTKKPQFSKWVSLIEKVKKVYSGKLTYAANHDEYDHVGFWRRLDFIGIDAYFSIADEPNASREEMEVNLREVRDTLKSFSRRHRRPILFTEIGYRSVDGATIRPYSYDTDPPEDLEEQAMAYQAVLNVFQNESWLRGIFWWYWDAALGSKNPSDSEYLIHGKPAEDVLRSFWVE